MAEKHRLQIWYTGRVQGVGFRYKTTQIAAGFDVCGFVENLDDGRVHLLAVGDESETRAFADEIAKVMRDFIKSTDERADTADAEAVGIDSCLYQTGHAVSLGQGSVERHATRFRQHGRIYRANIYTLQPVQFADSEPHGETSSCS